MEKLELIDVIQQIVQDTVQAHGPLTTGYGTVKSTSPLTISVQATKMDVTEPVVILTDNVMRKEVTVQGETVIINPGLNPGDKVLFLRANAGQNYIIISKA